MRPQFCTIAVLSILSVLINATEMEGAPRNEPGIRFSHISANSGLSQNTVLSIVQDSTGNMWFATFDGLNRFDGYDFTVYRHSDDDTTSIGDNTVRKVFLDSRGRIWAGTAAGLSLFDSRKETFTNWRTPEGFITGIEEVAPGKMMVSTTSKLRLLDTGTGKFIEDGIPENMSVMSANTLYRYGQDIYIGTKGNGLFVYSTVRNEFRRISSFRSESKINVIMFRNDSTLCIGTEGDGLFILDTGTEKIENYRHYHRTVSSGGISSNFVRSLATDSEGRLWIGTFGGLDIYENGRFTSLSSDPFTHGSLSQNSVRSIFRDNQEGMWLGTFFGGVNYWNPLRNRFRNIQRTQNSNSINDNIISCIVEDLDGILWIGTNSGGVNRYSPETGKFTSYPLQKRSIPSDMESNDIKAIFADSSSPNVYIGAHAGGLNILNRNTGDIRHISGRSRHDAPGDVYSIIRADGRNLWIGSLEGLWIYDTVSEVFTPVRLDTNGMPIGPKLIRALLVDRSGNLWIGGEDGIRICRITGNDRITCRNETGLDGLVFIQCFFESSTGMIWIGTRKGLYGYEQKTGDVRHYTESDGLPNNIIHGIEEDSNGRLWISTDHGLSCFNPFSESFRNYTVNDGLQSNLFNTGSHCRTRAGEMYFGGINGITVFTPEKLEDNPFSPQPVITRLSVLNHEIHPSDGSGILQESISSAESITLRHWQNYFTLGFSVPNYLAGRHNTFAYMLEGFDKDWNTVYDQRSVSYSNLPHGRYRFLLKAANNDGKWNPTPTVLEIRVRPVWYQSTIAIIAFILLAAGAIVGIVIFIVERKNMENRLKLEKQESEHLEEISQMKIRFFINISHELRSPLTLIINPLQEMISRATDLWMRKQLKYVERNTQRLLHLVNQLMDYRRAELGVFKLKVRQEDAARIVKENCAYYDNLAKSKKLKYNFISEIDDRKMYVDGQYLELIVNNLLSNAFKYTDEGSITVGLSEKDGNLVLKVSDTGKGIPEAERDKIFERFYQLESKYIGSGIGLSLVQRLVELHHGSIGIDSTEGKGSTFTVTFPQNPEVYSAEEMDTEDKHAAHTTNSREMYMLDAEVQPEEELNRSGYVKRGKIMIVEDNEEIRTYMHNGLSKYFEIILASDGAEALEMLKEQTVDIVITDMIMPVMDGMKLCAAIKQNSETSHIPVIVISASTDRKDELEAIRTGADGYMQKPFSMAVLTGKVQNIMRTQRRLHDKVTKTLDIVPEKVTFNPVDEDFLKRAVAIIEKNLDNAEFSTDNFAKEMNMSRSNLHIRLKAITGESALDFIHKVRFKEACRLLDEGKLTVSEISDKVGFSTPSYFATCFKKYMGCIPSEYVRNRERQS